MRTFLYLLLSFILHISCKAQEAKQKSELQYKGQMIDILVDKVLYEDTNPSYFYLKFEIKNKSNEKVGLDLTDPWKILYPNQWGYLTKPQRTNIDEMRIIPDQLNELKEDSLKNKFQLGMLQFIKPNESFVYYTEFNANGKSKIDADAHYGNYMFVSLDGQLFVTNGMNCERVSFEEDTGWEGELILKKPFKWKTIKDTDLIIHR